MLIWIISITVFVIGIVTLLLYKISEAKFVKYRDLLTDESALDENLLIKHRKKYQTYKRIINTIEFHDTFCVIMMLCVTIGSIAIISCSLAMIIERSPRKVNNEVEKLLMEKEVLVYRLENDDNLNGNELLYKDVLEFNTKIYDYKISRENPWINWFIDPAYSEIQMIDFKKVT